MRARVKTEILRMLLAMLLILTAAGSAFGAVAQKTQKKILSYGDFQIEVPDSLTYDDGVDELGRWFLKSRDGAEISVTAELQGYQESAAVLVQKLKKAEAPEYRIISGAEALIYYTEPDREQAQIRMVELYLLKHVLTIRNEDGKDLNEEMLQLAEAVTVAEGGLPFFAYSVMPERLAEKGLQDVPYLAGGVAFHLPKDSQGEEPEEGTVILVPADNSYRLVIQTGDKALKPTGKELLEQSIRASGLEGFRGIDVYQQVLLNDTVYGTYVQFGLEYSGKKLDVKAYCFKLPGEEPLSLTVYPLTKAGEDLWQATEDTIHLSNAAIEKSLKTGYAALGLKEEAVEFEGISIHMPDAFTDMEEDHPVWFDPRYYDSVQILKKDAMDYDAQTKEAFEKAHLFSDMGKPLKLEFFQKIKLGGVDALTLGYRQQTAHSKLQAAGRTQEDCVWVQIFFPDRTIEVHFTDASGTYTQEITESMKTLTVLQDSGAKE